MSYTKYYPNRWSQNGEWIPRKGANSNLLTTFRKMGNVTAGVASEGEDDETEFLEVWSIQLRHDHANAIFINLCCSAASSPSFSACKVNSSPYESSFLVIKLLTTRDLL